MAQDLKQTLSKEERAISTISISLGNFANGISRITHRRGLYTVRQLCEMAGIEAEAFSDSVKSLLDKHVSQVCRAGSRFTKNCICCQLYNDGDQLLEWAMEHGALLCVSMMQIKNYPCIVTDNPTKMYSMMCEAFRNLCNIDAIAVIGSIGKTTAKKMLASVYGQQLNTFCDAGNENQIDCVGYITQHIPKKSEAWIQEVSEDTKDCVTYISRIVKPKITVITAIDKSHIEQFGDQEGILHEIHSILDYMPEDGICITSIDEDNTRTLVSERKVISVSLSNKEADYYSSNITIDEQGLKFEVNEKATRKVFAAELECVYAKHNIYAALYAFAAGVYSGISYENIIKGIKKYKATGNRQNIYKTKGVTVYADCYNAVAKSVRSAVNACDIIPVTGKRVAVLGDIAETGNFAEQIHMDIVDIINNSRFNVFYAFGENICKAAENSKLRDDITVITFTDRAELNKVLKKTLKKGDLVLFKASHSGNLESSLKHVFPCAYTMKTLEYAWPQLIWRLKVIFC